MPLFLRVPRFTQDLRYVFPPVNLTCRDSSPVDGTSDSTSHINCFNSLACPHRLKFPPSVAPPTLEKFIQIWVLPSSRAPRFVKEARAISPARPGTQPWAHDAEEARNRTSVPLRSTEESGSSDDTLFLSADQTPETLSSSLFASPPLKLQFLLAASSSFRFVTLDDPPANVTCHTV